MFDHPNFFINTVPKYKLFARRKNQFTTFAIVLANRLIT